MWKNIKAKLFGATDVVRKNKFKIEYRIEHFDTLGCPVIWDEGVLYHFTGLEIPNQDEVISMIRNDVPVNNQINRIMVEKNIANTTLHYAYNYTKEDKWK